MKSNTQLLDITGRIVAEFEFNKPSYVFKKEGTKSGIYFLKITSESNEQYLKRLVFK